MVPRGILYVFWVYVNVMDSSRIPAMAVAISALFHWGIATLLWLRNEQMVVYTAARERERRVRLPRSFGYRGLPCNAITQVSAVTCTLSVRWKQSTTQLPLL